MVDFYVNDIKTSLQNKCYFPALALSLALPDICGTAEYPSENSTAKRYIQWYDAYVEAHTAALNEVEPYLSGEIVYNLRNMFLHTGSPNVDSNKVKEESNQLDKFTLFLGDGTKIWSLTLFIETPIVEYRMICVDVSYLCNLLCDCALSYYQNNQNKFHYNFQVDTQEHLFGSSREMPPGDPIIKALNKKLEETGSSARYIEPTERTISRVLDGHHKVVTDEAIKQKTQGWRYEGNITLQDENQSYMSKASPSHQPSESQKNEQEKAIPDKKGQSKNLTSEKHRSDHFSVSTSKKRSLSRKKNRLFKQYCILKQSSSSIMPL